ncbi:DNA cytosine methyltransferase [Mesorhizobium sp.]|uniref:DNA cytosine methyltransferase n=1 Tax=Mesorhizobium sp. TaxID=1871066 RepID=UPI002635E504|nr:DNA cytosine methyltransferase [Mesorhizobium sp.]
MSTISVTGILAFTSAIDIHGSNRIHQEPDLPATFGVVDLFAGPGGLGEGFASFVENGHKPFHIGISVEKEASAHRTLTLRAFLREYRVRYHTLPKEFVEFHAGLIPEPDWAAVDTDAWRMASAEARCLELGTGAAAAALEDAITKLRSESDDTILIGGPPCQAYSLVGRARAKGKRGYVPENDERHYLFREYIRVLDQLRPAAFVMENVKGMLSSTVESRLVFELLMEDLSSLGTQNGHLYELRAIRVEDGKVSFAEARQPSDFIVQAEEFGVPQRRHRVIIVGLRSDLVAGAAQATVDTPETVRTVDEAIGDLPALRSGLSRASDSAEAWRGAVTEAASFLADIHCGESHGELRETFTDLAQRLRNAPPSDRSSSALPDSYANSNDDLMSWLERPELRAVAQHETRGHMTSDLGRYMFAAVFGKVRGCSPKAADFPQALSPDHRNWHTGAFADRFRVQLAHEPSTTVTSHISKDGHYFIHPDPDQCRSLTVREAARLQTFPDDYLFLGNRTQQYVQVGNAVPPFLARQIARLLRETLIGTGSPR